MKRIDVITETNIIKEYENGKTMNYLSKKYSIGKTSVMNILDRYGIPKRSAGGKIKLPHDLIIESYKSGKSTGQLSTEYCVSVKTICDILKKHNIPRNNRQGYGSLDVNFWKNIDTPAKAYFLGWMITDGNVWNKQVRIEIQSEDEYILEIFKSNIDSKCKIHRRTRHTPGMTISYLSSLTTYCEQWVDDLSKYNITPNKTFTVSLPEISNDLMPHLIRGIIDGDGSISKNGGSISIYGNYELLMTIRNFLVNKLNINNASISKHQTIYQLSWGSKKDVEKLGNYIYEDKQDLYLKRKYDKWFYHGNPEVN